MEILPEKVKAIIQPRKKRNDNNSRNVLNANSEPSIPAPKTTSSPSFNDLPPDEIDNETDIKFFHFSANEIFLIYNKKQQ